MYSEHITIDRCDNRKQHYKFRRKLGYFGSMIDNGGTCEIPIDARIAMGKRVTK